MAKKPLFQSLVESNINNEDSQPKAPSFPASRPMQKMKASLLDLQKSAVQEIRLDLIDQFQFHDRIDVEEELDGLAESLRERGQEVPIKVRPIEGSNRFEVIIGRRRCAAARRLGWVTIRGMVQESDDLEALAAMITENSQRRETSYIGRARLCHRVIQSGVSQSALARTMGCSQAHISQMLRSYKMLGDEVIHAVGDAVGCGRTAWDPLGEAMTKLGMSPADAAGLVEADLPGSVERLEQLRKVLDTRLKEASPAPSGKDGAAGHGQDARDIWRGKCQVKRSGNSVTIKRLKDAPEDMLDYIQDRLPEIIKEYRDKKNVT